MADATTDTATAEPAPRTQPPVGRMWPRALQFWLMSYRRVWRGSLVSGFLAPVLYLSAMGYLLGPLVDSGTRGGIPGVEYLAFVAPGILAAQAMQTAVSESTFAVLAAIKWRRQYLAMLATPLGVPDVLVGHLVFVLLRVAMTSTVFLGVAVALGAIRTWWAVLMLPVAVLCGLAFAAPVFAFAGTQSDGQGFNVLFRFIIMPMFLFSGTFFPIDQLPGVLEPVAWATPLAHAVALCRDLALGTATGAAAALHVGYLLVWIVVGYRFALASFRRRLVV
ncbi:MAG: ABC transporter permease [Actinomycetota bacterium]